MLFVIFSSILLNLNPVKAAINPESIPQKAFEVPFYKSTSSLFPSGSTNIENLKKQLISAPQSPAQYYKWEKLLFAQDEIKPFFAAHLSKFVVDPLTNTRFKVVETKIKTLQLFDEQTKIIIKKSISEVQADAYDLGFAMTLRDVYLTTLAKKGAPVQTTIPQGTRLDVEKYINKFGFVKYQNYEGFVNLSDLITKFDFATFVYAENNWHQVNTRKSDRMITSKKASIPLSTITGMITPDIKGIIASNSQKIPLWSRIEVIRNKISIWNQSKLKDHGFVWWKSQKDSAQIYYSIDELLKKEISSVSFHPLNPLKGILSANGVYITEDGYYWKKIQQFENFNGPVHYFNDLLLFVGNFRSTDGGASFDNYIQIDKLASAIEFQFGFFPKKLQVRKIETMAPFKLKIEIETGIRKIKMESPLFAQDWKAVKS